MATAFAPSDPPDEHPRPPHRLWYLTEVPRALGELAAFCALKPALSRLPRGDGHGVLILPGFLASDRTTRPLRSLLRQLGYEAKGWGLGRNDRLDEVRLAAVRDSAVRLHRRTGRKVSLIGWSLGGVFAREIARHAPELIRQVISLGAPISGDPRHSQVSDLFYRLNPDVPLFDHLSHSIGRPPPVPSTAIYAPSDGVVAWRGAIQQEGPQAENVAVHGSHIGFPINPTALMVIADRLAQRDGEWRPFRPRGWRKLLYPRPDGG